jgi:hypothetical protein
VDIADAVAAHLLRGMRDLASDSARLEAIEGLLV